MRAIIFLSKVKYNFQKYTEYIVSKAEKSEIIDSSSNIILSSPIMISSSFELQSQSNRKVRYPALHLALSFTENETIDKNIIRRYLKEMKWEDTQYIAVKHLDRPRNPHCHIVLNMVNNNGARINDSYCITKSNIVCRKISNNYISDTTNNLKEIIDIALKESSSIDELKINLNMEFVEMSVEKDQIEFYEISNPTLRIKTDYFEIFNMLEVGPKSNLPVCRTPVYRIDSNSKSLDK